MNKFAALLLLFLAACGGGSSPPSPTPSPPVPVCQAVGQACPAGGSLYWSLNTAAPGNIALYFLDDGPGGSMADHTPTGSDWGVLPAPGNAGDSCVNFGPAPLFPLPNVCYSAGAAFGFSNPTAGMALISVPTIDPSVSISTEMVVTATNNCAITTDSSVVGPVFYNGENNYLAFYLACNSNGPVLPAAYGAAGVSVLSNTPIVPGSTHTLRIDVVPAAGIVRFVMDNIVLGIANEPAGFFTSPPHWALWTVSVTGTVLSWNNYMGGT